METGKFNLRYLNTDRISSIKVVSKKNFEVVYSHPRK